MGPGGDGASYLGMLFTFCFLDLRFFQVLAIGRKLNK